MPTQKSFSAADPAIVPVEGPVLSDVNAAPGAVGKQGAQSATQSSPYGPNNEQLPEQLAGSAAAAGAAIFDGVGIFAAAGNAAESSRRTNSGEDCNICGGTRRDQNWHLPFEQKLTDASSIEDLPRYEFVTNIYQAFGLSLMAVLSQDVPRVRFFPSSAQAEEDVAAAKAATEVAQLVERNNRIGNLIVDEAFNLWTDGKVGAYVRFVVDGQRFGFHPEMEIGSAGVRLGRDCMFVRSAGRRTPAAKQSGETVSRSAEPNAVRHWSEYEHAAGVARMRGAC